MLLRHPPLPKGPRLRDHVVQVCVFGSVFVEGRWVELREGGIGVYLEGGGGGEVGGIGGLGCAEGTPLHPIHLVVLPTPSSILTVVDILAHGHAIHPTLLLLVPDFYFG